MNTPGPQGEGTDTLRNVEYVVFNDVLLGFGTRVEEVARVAFVLWSKEIYTSRNLFGIGLSFYGVGYEFDTLCAAALNYWGHLSNAELATHLIGNSAGTTRTAQQLMDLMAAAGGNAAARAQAVKLMAQDSTTTGNLELMGVYRQGVEAALVVDGAVLFGLTPG